MNTAFAEMPVTNGVSKRPEIQLLLYCARTRMDSRTAERIKALIAREHIDWSYLYQSAIQHLQIPLLYQNLSAIFRDGIPLDFFSKLETDFYHNSAWNLFLTSELTKLLCLFRDHDIPAVPFKGPVLAASVYGSLQLRVFTDLDIFVLKRDLAEIEKLLAAEGYWIVHQTDKQKSFVLKHKYSIQFFDPQKRAYIEIHWKFTRNKLPFSIDSDNLLKRAQFVRLGGVDVKDFCPPDLLLLLCIHGAKHRWMRLGWLCDVAELIRLHPELDWPQIIHQAKVMRVSRILFLALILLQDLLDVTLPDEVVQQIKKDSTANSLASSIRNYLLSGDPATLYEEPDFYIKVREKLRDKAITFLYYLRLDASNLKKKNLERLHNFYNTVSSLFRTGD